MYGLNDFISTLHMRRELSLLGSLIRLVHNKDLIPYFVFILEMSFARLLIDDNNLKSPLLLM